MFLLCAEFWLVNLSDLARIAIMYTSGGLYTDSDILALRPVENLKNVLAIQVEAVVLPNYFVFGINNGI